MVKSAPSGRPLVRAVPEWPLLAVIAGFLSDRQVRNLSPRTIQFYRCELGLWCRWLVEQGATNTVAITPDLLRRWLLHLGQTRNAGGVHASYRALRAFLRWTWEENEIEVRNPIGRVKAPKLSQDPLEPLSIAVLKALLRTCSRASFTGSRDRAMLMALLDTGCRASEFLSLNVGDVDLVTGAVAVRHGKGGRPRLTFVGARSRRALRHYLGYRPHLSADAPLWATTQGAQLTYHGLRNMVRRRARRAGVSTPTLHSFRRAFALSSLRNGVDVYSLQRLMGHTDLSMLRRYLRQTDADLREAHRKAGPVDNVL